MWKLILITERLRQFIQMFTITFVGYEMYIPAIFDWLF